LRKVTAHLCGRPTIENLGVKPDIEYAVTASDLQNSFADYGKAISAPMANLLK
jgi:hypothetical protein